MRVKINRYEFAIKEALLFLAKPMEAYTTWLSLDASKSVDYNDNNHDKKPIINLNPAQLAILQQKSVVIGNNTVNISTGTLASKTVEEITNKDIPTLECVRLSLKYLKDAQAAALNIQPRKSDNVNQMLKNMDSEINQLNPEFRPLLEDNLKAGPTREESSFMDFKPEKIPEPSHSDQILKEIADRQINPPGPNKPKDKKNNKAPINIDDDEGDLALPSNNNDGTTATPRQKGKACTSCHEYMLQIDHFTDQVSYLKRDVTTLINLLSEEKSCRQRVQLSKDILDQELEELTAQLFDQANKMVIDESKLREGFETMNHTLEGDYAQLNKKFVGKEVELRDLRKIFAGLEESRSRSVSFTASPRQSMIASNTPDKSSSFVPTYFYENAASFFSSRIGPNHSLYQFIPVDGIFFNEFTEFIKILHACASSPTSYATYHKSTFMARCMAEDVDPCLFYMYQAHNPLIKASSISSSFKRKLLEGVEKGCEIKRYWSSKENVYLGTSELIESPLEESEKDWGSSNTTQNDFGPPKKKCATCGIIKECDYRLRFVVDKPPNTFSDWNHICRFCRDRVSCVADFFTFITHLRQGVIGPGKQGVTILGLFRQMVLMY